MKTKYIFLILCFLGIAMGSCKDDSASNPTFADDELYIYTDMLESVSAIAGTLTEFPILVSPADGSVSVKWLLDGEVIGTAPTLSYTFTQTGSFKLRFEAVRNGTTNFREFTASSSDAEEPPRKNHPRNHPRLSSDTCNMNNCPNTRFPGIN